MASHVSQANMFGEERLALKNRDQAHNLEFLLLRPKELTFKGFFYSQRVCIHVEAVMMSTVPLKFNFLTFMKVRL